jgi:hypothetical protein
VVTAFWAAIAALALLWPGFATSTNLATWDDSPDAFKGERLQYELVPLAIFVGIGVLFYVLGAPTRRRQVQISLADEHVLSAAERDEG